MASLLREAILPTLRSRCLHVKPQSLKIRQPLLARPTSFNPRCFSTSILRRAQPPKPNHINAKRNPLPSELVREQSSYAFLKGLSTKKTPTVLYQAPSHFWFYVASWSSGICLIGWITFTLPAALNQPEGVPAFVGYTLIVANVLIGSMGLYMITKTPGIINAIRVIPAQSASSGKIAGKGVAAITQPAPHIEVEVKRMVPFLSHKTIKTSFDKVVLKNRLSLPSEYVPELQRQNLRRVEELRKEELRRFDMNHIMTMPFRRMGRAFAAFFNGVKTAWTDMGFGKIQVDGKWYKVDVTKGFAHDGFRSLEKIAKIQK